MSDKLLKDGLRTSDKIGGLTVFAELLFVRLLLATCPLGRCPWRPDWILAHALPNRPHTRLTTITAALTELRARHLVHRYTHDGDAYLTIPNHGQRFKHAVRSAWPAPPEGPPDAEGQVFMALPGAPPSGGLEKKAKPVCVSSHTHFSSESSSESETRARGRGTPPTSDLRLAATCLPELAGRYPRHDLPACLRAATRYARKERGDDAEVTLGWFVSHWLPFAAEKKSEAPPCRDTPAAAAARQAAHARWSAQQAAQLATLLAGPEPVKGTLDHAIWLEGKKSA